MIIKTDEQGISRELSEYLQANILYGEENACWGWSGDFDTELYPAIKRGKMFVRINRLIYELFNGSVLKTDSVYRNCWTKGCTNPKHMFAFASGYGRRINKKKLLNANTLRKVLWHWLQSPDGTPLPEFPKFVNLFDKSNKPSSNIAGILDFPIIVPLGTIEPHCRYRKELTGEAYELQHTRSKEPTHSSKEEWTL